jgi:hypothetical protein
MPGLRMEVTVDSLRGDVMFGRLSLAFSGDVGIDPSRFLPFVDTLTADTVTMHMRAVEPDAPDILMRGVIGAGSIDLSTFVLGGDTLSGPGRNWLLSKRP